MGTRLYVGNLPFKTTNEDLSALFSQAGQVEDVQVMTDMATGRARGFAFVQMGSDEAAQKAISEFHQYSLDGRALVVNEARPRSPGGDFARGGGPSGPREPRW
jgi:cold-inducible RNA-binding protein